MENDPIAAAAAARAEQQRQAQRQAEMEMKLSDHVQSFPVKLALPANVLSPETAATAAAATSDDSGSAGDKDKASSPSAAAAAAAAAPRTDQDFVNIRLMESGIKFDEVQSLGEASAAVANFVDGMKSTGCYDSVQVAIGRPAPVSGEDADTAGQSQEAQQARQGGGDNGNAANAAAAAAAAAAAHVEPRHLDVILGEKRWYKLYIGGGIKHEGIIGGSSSGSSIEQLPRVQMETSAGLLNVSGCSDVTSAAYTVDQTGATTLGLSHDRPLYSCFAPYSALYNAVLTNPLLNASNTALRVTGRMDTVDWECARSSRDRTRSIGVKICNWGHVAVPEAAKDAYVGLEWTAAFRDVLPRRHPSSPYACDASPEIVAQAGPSWKHSLLYQHRLNNSLCDDKFNPTSGVDAHWSWEVAGPPGDVGFVKGTGGAALHVPVVDTLGGISLHASINGGFIRPITYGGLCPSTTSITDRFYVGGPIQLRGFMHSGIGPRAETGGKSTAGGDALGGDLFYTATVAASIPFPGISLLRDNGMRLFTFANAGTLTGLDATPASAILRSTRASVGGGLAIGTPMGRLEATYAVPLRYGPRDARRSVQFGLGFSFG